MAKYGNFDFSSSNLDYWLSASFSEIVYVVTEERAQNKYGHVYKKTRDKKTVYPARITRLTFEKKCTKSHKEYIAVCADLSVMNNKNDTGYWFTLYSQELNRDVFMNRKEAETQISSNGKFADGLSGTRFSIKDGKIDSTLTVGNKS